jgi:integrase
MARDKRAFGTIRKMPSGRYQALYTNTVGKRVFAPHTFAARVDAEGWLHERRREVELGRYNPSAVVRRSKVTFGGYAAAWLAGRHVAGRPIKPRTRAHYQDILDAHLLPTFGNRQLGAITPKDVREWHAVTLVDKPTMRAHAYSLLATIMGSAVKDEVVDANPCRITGAGRTRRVRRIKPASVAEIAALTDAMPDRLAPMVLLASWCALRFGETVELRRGDVDLGAEVIHIRRAAVRVKQHVDEESPKYAYQVGSPKSDASIRDVAIPPHLLPVLEQHLAKHVGATRDSLVFPAANGNHLRPATLYRHWYKARASIGRDDLRWHDLRHSGAVLAAATGASLAELMGRLGHSTPGAALRYQHVAAGRDREIAALLSKLANG